VQRRSLRGQNAVKEPSNGQLSAFDTGSLKLSENSFLGHGRTSTRINQQVMASHQSMAGGRRRAGDGSRVRQVHSSASARVAAELSQGAAPCSAPESRRGD